MRCDLRVVRTALSVRLRVADKPDRPRVKFIAPESLRGHIRMHAPSETQILASSWRRTTALPVLFLFCSRAWAAKTNKS